MPDSEVVESPDDVRFLRYSGLVVLTASLSESDPRETWAGFDFCGAHLEKVRLASSIFLSKTDKHRNLLAHASERLHDEIAADYTDMIYAATREEIEARRKAFIRKWRLKHRAVTDSLEEAGDRLFTFTRLPPSQWRSARTTNAIERLHEEFKRRIKTQTVLPSADTAAMLFWALLASGQINMRKIDGWQTLATKPIDQPIDLAA